MRMRDALVHFTTQIPQLAGSSGRLDLIDHTVGSRAITVEHQLFKALPESGHRQTIFDDLPVTNLMPEAVDDSMEKEGHFFYPAGLVDVLHGRGEVELPGIGICNSRYKIITFIN